MECRPNDRHAPYNLIGGGGMTSGDWKAAWLAAFALLLASNSCRAAQADGSHPPPSPAERASLSEAIGSANAPVTVIEYVSPTCLGCARFQREDFPELKKKYIDTGKVRYIFRATLIHESLDGPAYLLAGCVGKDKFFKVIDVIMRGQNEYFVDAIVSGPNGETQIENAYWSLLMRTAKAEGLDEQTAATCLTDGDAATRLQDRLQAQAAEYDVNSVPTFIVNGKKVNGPEGVLMGNNLIFPAIDQALKNPVSSAQGDIKRRKFEPITYRPASDTREELARYAVGAMSKLNVANKVLVQPDVPFNDAAGRAITLAQFRGKVVIVNLWASWCAPCETEIPALAALQRAESNRDLVVVPISVDRGVSEAKSFIAAQDPLPLFIDLKFSMPIALGVTGLPTSVIYDRKGREVGRFTGAANWDSAEARALVDHLLAGDVDSEQRGPH